MSKYEPKQPSILWKAEMIHEPPFRTGKPKGRAAEGLRFQKRVHKKLSALGEVLDNPWFKYHDIDGQHYCQPDSVMCLPDRTICVESKLSLRRLDAAISQLARLYVPILWHVFGQPVVPVVAFHHWFAGAELTLIDDPKSLFHVKPTESHKPYGWHLL